MFRYKKILFSVCSTALLLFLIFYFIDFSAFLDSLKDVEPIYLAMGVLCQIFIYILRAKRFEFILNIKGLKRLFSISTVHFFLNKVLPARTGELSLPLLFKKFSNVSLTDGFGALLFFRFLDLFSVISLFSISLIFVDTEHLNSPLVIFISAAVLLAMLLFWSKLTASIGITRAIVARVQWNKLERIRAKIEKLLDHILLYKQTKNSAFLAGVLALSIANWLLTYLFFFSIILAFHLDYNFIQVIFASTISNFTFILPISTVGSFGTFEAGWAIGFMLLGMTVEMAVPIGLFTNVFGMIINGVLASIGYFYLTSSEPKS